MTNPGVDDQRRWTWREWKLRFGCEVLVGGERWEGRRWYQTVATSCGNAVSRSYVASEWGGTDEEGLEGGDPSNSSTLALILSKREPSVFLPTAASRVP